MPDPDTPASLLTLDARSFWIVKLKGTTHEFPKG
jgi:hypothetical protein